MFQGKGNSSVGKGKSLHQKRKTLIFFILLATLGPVLLLGGYRYFSTYREMTEHTLSHLETSTHFLTHIFKERFDRLKDLGTSLANREELISSLQSGNWEQAMQKIQEVPGKVPFIERIFISDPEGNLKADTLEASEVLGKNFTTRDWYQGVVKNWQPYLSEFYRRTTTPTYSVATFAFPILSKTQKPLGILGLQIRLLSLFDWVKDIQETNPQFIYFLDQKGHVAVLSKATEDMEAVDFSALPFVKKLLEGEEGTEIFINPFNSQEEVVSYHPIPGYGWSILWRQPTELAFVSRDQNLKQILFLYGILLVCNALLAVLILNFLEKQRKSRAEAQKTHALSDAIAKAMPVGIFRADAEGNCTYVNEYWEKLSGQTPHQALGRGWTMTVHPEDREKVYSQLEQSLKKGAFFNLEFRVQNKEGKTLWIYSQSVAERDSSGQVVGFIGAFMDLTEKKQTEEALQKTQAQFSQAQQLAHLGMWSWDLTTGKMVWDRRIYEIFDVPFGTEATYELFLQKLHYEDLERVQNELMEYLKKEETTHLWTYRVVTSKKEIRYIEGSSHMERSPDKQPIRILGVVQDVTEQKHREQEMRVLREVLKERTAVLEKTYQKLAAIQPPPSAVEKLDE